MKIACTLVLFVMLRCYVNARNIPGTCRTHTGIILLSGEEWKDPNHCSTYRCSIFDGEAELEGVTCAAYHVPPHCRLVSAANELYPQCCPTVICSDKSR
uniref:Venom toxin OcyC11 n=1 Tax=Opisthacanthus cayaporum TaxID=573324 RepID=LA1_OPICY